MSAPPPPGVEIDDGVIEDARRRQRRRRRGIGAVVGGAAIAAIVLGLSLGAGGSGPANASFETALGGPVKLSFVHRFTAFPYLAVGWTGWCIDLTLVNGRG